MLDRLEQAGYKVTEPRRRVLSALRASDEPLTAQEVAGRAGVSVASTYRVLSLLCNLGVVNECADLAQEGDARGKRYTLCTAREHHHHFTCRVCHATLEVHCDALEDALSQLEEATGMRIERHEITLRGVCQACLTGTEAEA
jgi:Fe2+ or Zn2+ uptake regulation protein